MTILDNRCGPLSGVRVLELGQIAAGPYAGSLFADLGADVVKVENPSGGDGMRGWPPLTAKDGGAEFSENFASLNRNKRSVALDLKDEGDVRQLKALVAVADILIENFRPGVLSRLGLAYDDFAAINPRLVYCSISGYGQKGPYSERGAFDVTIQAISGLMSITGHDGMPPVKCGVPVADFCAGLYGAFATMAALTEARETGKGAHVDCSMLGSLLGVAALQTSEFFGTDRSNKPMGSAHPRNAPYQAYRAKDEYVVIAAGNDSLWAEVAESIEMPELVRDPRFGSQRDRAKNQIELRDILESRFKERTAAEWIKEMDKRGVPCAPINTYAEVMADPHVEAMGLVRPLRLPNGVTTRTIAFPVNISGYHFEIYRDPPALGAHNNEVVQDWLSSANCPRSKPNSGAS